MVGFVGGSVKVNVMVNIASYWSQSSKLELVQILL